MSIENDINIPAMLAATSQGKSYPVSIHKIPIDQTTCDGCIFKSIPAKVCESMQCGIGESTEQQYIYIIAQ